MSTNLSNIITRRQFIMQTLAALPLTASVPQIVATILDDPVVATLDAADIERLTAPVRPGEIEHLRGAIAALDAMLADKRRRWAWVQAAEGV